MSTAMLALAGGLFEGLLDRVGRPDPGWLVPGGLVVAKVTLVLALAWTAVAALRRGSAATRHRVIALALLACLVLPALSLVLPRWAALPWPVSSTDEGIGGRAGGVEGVAVPRRATVANPDLPATALAPARQARVSPERPWPSVFNVAAVWAIGSGFLILVLAAQILSTTHTVWRSREVRDRAWLATLEQARRKLGVRGPVALRRAETSAMPFIWGWRKPTILLPRDCDTWTTERREAVLAHELAHVVRRDMPVHLMSHLACAAYWFNPLCWLLKRRLAYERELASDSMVVALVDNPPQYAQHLLETAMAYRRSPGISPVMAARTQLEGRIMAILESPSNRTHTSRLHPSVLPALLLIAVIPFASLTLVTTSPVVAENAPGGTLGGDRWSAGRAGDSDTARFRAELRRLGVDRSDVPSLLAGLDSPSATLRGASAWALGRAGAARAVEPLIAALADPDAVVRQWSVRSLSALADLRAVMPLIDRLDDPDAEVREWVVRSLSDLGDERAIEPLTDLLDDENAEVREWVVRSLAGNHDERVTQLLRDRLDDEDGDVREWAARALGGPVTETGFRYRRRADGSELLLPGLDQTIPSPGDPQTIAALIRSLGNDDVDVREWSARSLGDMGDASAVWPLTALTRDPSADVREWAIRSLGSLRDPQAVDPLIEALGDPSPAVREWSIRSLGRLQDERMVWPLIGRLDDESQAVREWAARGLGAYGDQRAKSALVRLLDDEVADVRYWAGRALENLGS